MPRFGTCEIFKAVYWQCPECDEFWSDDIVQTECTHGDPDRLEGYWYWCCFPGCLPEGDPIGPFKTVTLAYADAVENDFITPEDDDTIKPE